MPSTDLIGYLAASLTTAAFLPQAWLTWKTRCADGISLAMYGIFTVGTALWLAYGLQLGAMPIVMANLIILLLTCFILIMKIRYK